VQFLPDLLESLSLNDPWIYLAVFLGVSLLMLWRSEAMLDHGLEGTAMGTLLLPYCSGFGNLVFVWLMIERHGSPAEVVTNCLVNNVTNLTMLLGVPALFWTLVVVPVRASGGGEKSSKGKKKAGASGKSAAVQPLINRLSLLLTLLAALFFTGAVWLLGQDGKLDRIDGLALIGLFAFWQCVQVFDTMKYNVQRRAHFGIRFYLDVLVILACAWLLYESLDWLVNWLSQRRHGFVSRENLGWLTGWLMVLPNAILALYWGWRRRPDVVFSSQIGDGHICIPLCLGLFALVKPLPIAGFAPQALLVIVGAAVVHGVLLMTTGGLPRWAGALLVLAYGWFVWAGLLA